MKELMPLLGLAAGALTTAALVPQVLKSYKTKSTKDVSLVMFICTMAGTLLWLAYGIYLRDFPIICANTITSALAAVVVALKLKYK